MEHSLWSSTYLSIHFYYRILNNPVVLSVMIVNGHCVIFPSWTWYLILATVIVNISAVNQNPYIKSAFNKINFVDNVGSLLKLDDYEFFPQTAPPSCIKRGMVRNLFWYLLKFVGWPILKMWTRIICHIKWM